nr:Cyclic nucleotide-binding domain-containing protein 2 [Polyrhizophydium stewartii]
MRIWSSGQLTDEIDPADASEKFEMHMKRLRHAQGLLTDAGSVPGKVFDALEGLTNKYFHKPMPKVELRQYEKAWRARKGMVGSDERLEDFKRGAAVKRIIHNHFLGDFWEIYQNAHRSRQGTLVNGFEPKTWHRLSGAAYREHIEKEQKRKAELSEIVGKTRAQIVGKAGPASVGNMAGGPDAATSGAVSASAALIASSAAGGGSAISVPVTWAPRGANDGVPNRSAAKKQGQREATQRGAATKLAGNTRGRIHYMDPLNLGSDEIIARIMLTMTHKHPSDAREFIKEWEAKNLATPLDRTKNMLDQAVEILQRNPAVTCVPRTSHEMLVLQEVLRPLPAFRRIADFVFAEICRLLVCDVLNDGEFIFKQGDIGTRWYVVLSGRVRIMINKPGFTSSDEEPERSLATVLGAGEAFGDHALVNDVPRVASAISDGRTVVARLEKSDFKRLMSLVHTLEQKELVYFLQKIPMLRELDQLGLRNIADRMTMRVLAPGTIVIREGEFKESVMFVRSGMCAVFREVTFSEPERQLLLGHIGAYESFNEEPAVVKIGTHAGSPFTVVAVDWVELGAVFAYGEWTNMALTYVPSPFAMLTNKDMARAFRVRHEMRRFSRFQRRLVADVRRAGGRPPASR